MTSTELIVKTPNLPHDFLLAQVLYSLSGSSGFIQKFQKELEQIAVGAEIRTFSGNITKPEDKKRAEIRTLKLINLGLEAASNVKGQADKLHDFKLAQAIILKKPLVSVYAIGKKMFDDDGQFAAKILKQSQIKIGDLWFRLISGYQFGALQQMSDLDVKTGTLKKHNEIYGIVVDIQKKLQIAPFLPINEEGLRFNEHWGTINKETFTNDHGIVDCFLSSLIIACLFRGIENLFVDKYLLESRKIVGKKLEQAGKTDKENVDFLRDWHNNLAHAIESDARTRLLYRDNPLNTQREFLKDFLKISVEEIKNFSELLYFEPGKFIENEKAIKEQFVMYFLIVADSLGIKKPKNFESIILQSFSWSANKIQEDINLFFETLNPNNAEQSEILKFWGQKIFLENRGNEGNFIKAISKSVIHNIDIAKLAEKSTDYILKATVDFVLWSNKNQNIFSKTFNPNIAVRERGGSRNLLLILKNVSPANSNGWSEEILREGKRFTDGQDSNDTYEIGEIPWVNIIMNNLAWDITHPSVIAELWQNGSDEIRDILYEAREKIKITVPALKRFYHFEHSDQRLFAFALEKLTNLDNLKTKASWDDLLERAENLPKTKTIIELAYKKSTER